uniref:Uncharacterized protein n=1 Tax=Arion vulgaris TaxID=1028688 RepID=A0A0B7BD27_9EUPU
MKFVMKTSVKSHFVVTCNKGGQWGLQDNHKKFDNGGSGGYRGVDMFGIS